MATDAQPDEVLGAYSISRYYDGDLVFRLSALDHITVVGITELIVGGENFPPTLRTGGTVREEWDFPLGEGHCIVVKKTA